MADFVELQPGMRVMVPSPEGAIAGYFSSTVRRIDRRGLLIDIPRLDGEDLFLKPGQQLKMFVQIHGRLYEFESRVRSADLQVLLEEPGAAKKTERRSFYRLMLSIPAVITIEQPHREGADEGDEEDDEPLTEEVTILDLSGGGARMRTDTELAVGTQFELKFPTDRRSLRLTAEVVRVTATETARGGTRHEAHCMFTDIVRGDQDEIVRFVFQKQREFSQRGVA